MKGKKLIMGVMVLALVGAFAGVGQATVWLDTTPLPGAIGGGSFTYYHDMPGDFSIPPDQLISAGLTISYKIGVAYGSVYVQGEKVDTGWIWDLDTGIDSSYYDIAVALDFFAGGPLAVKLSGLGAICFTQSDLRMEYINVPEPSTLLLLGSGLMGLVAYGRKKIKP